MAGRRRPSTFTLITTNHFEKQAARLPSPVYEQLKKKLKFLETNPRHPSLQTHEVRNAIGDFGGKIFEAYVTEKYRMTCEYGSREQIVLRNLDNHDECLKNP